MDKARRVIRNFPPISGESFRYLLRDEFTGDIAAGSVNNTLATDGLNTRIISDTENKLSIASNRLVFNDGKTVPAIGNPGLRYSATFKRRAGLTLEGYFRNSGSKQGSFGLHNATSASFSLKAGFRFINAKISDAITNTDLAVNTWSNADKLLRVVVRNVGYDLYISENGGLSFNLEHQNTTDTTTPFYIHAASYNLIGGLDWIRLSNKPRGPYYSSFYDNFERADTVATAGTAGAVGSLGQSPQGFPWVVSGSNLPYISSNHFVAAAAAGNAAYGFLYFPDSVMPHTLRATIEWNAQGGAGEEGLVVLIAGTEPLTDMVHAIFRRDNVSVTTWDNADGGSHTSIVSLSFTECALDTQYQIGLRISGNTVTVEAPDGQTASFEHASIGAKWGRKLCYELTSPVDLSAMPKIKDTTVLW